MTQKHLFRDSNSRIHINPAHRGEFTAYAKTKGMGVQEAAKSVLRNPNASTKRKRQAQFAVNAKKFNHGGNR